MTKTELPQASPALLSKTPEQSSGGLSHAPVSPEVTRVKEDKLLDLDRFEVLDLVPIPRQGDRMIRLRTLEEAVADLEEAGENGGTLLYLIQVRPRKTVQVAAAPSQVSPQSPAESSEAAPLQAVIASESGIEEALRRFDADATPELASAKAAAATARSGPLLQAENIYLSQGKLNLPYLTRTAELLIESGEYGLARNIYKTILYSGERTAMALLGTARCLEAEEKLEEARARFEESIAYQPELEAFQGLARLLIRQQKDSQAGMVLERALQLRETPKENRFELHRAAGNCWSRASQPESAERHYSQALALRPESEELLCNLGALQLQIGRGGEAEASFEAALKLNAASATALTGLGSCALLDDNLSAAKAWFARSLKVEIRNPTAIFHLVRCAYALKSYSVAEGLVEEYLAAAPANAHLLYSLAGLRFHLRKFDAARATCRRILELEADHAGARELLKRAEHLSE